MNPTVSRSVSDYVSPTRRLGALLFLCTGGLLVFFATLHSPFLYDDTHAIVENVYIERLQDFQETVGLGNIFNRSVLLLTFAINRHVGGLEVFGFHLVNILLHVCVAIVLYFLTADLIRLESVEYQRRLKNLPLVVAAIHLFNPVAVESVAYLSSRSSSLATLFYLLAFYTFVRFVNTKADNQPPFKYWVYPALILLLLFLGAATKEIVITMPLMAAGYLWVRNPWKENKQWLPLFGGLLVLPVIYLIYRYANYGSLLVIQTEPASSRIDRFLYLLTQIKVMVSYYLLKLLVPINLNFEPDVRLVSGWTDPSWIVALAGMVLLAVLLTRQKSVLMRCGFVWALVTVLPTSSIIPLQQAATEHRTYLPGLGISLCLGILFLLGPGSIMIRRLALAVFLVLISLLTLNRGLDYQTEVALWQDTARKSPNKAMVHNNLGAAYLVEGRYAEAAMEMEATLKLDPDRTNPYINLGHIQARQQNWAEARKWFDEAIARGATRSQVFFNAGLVRMQQGKPGEALPYLQEAIRRKQNRAIYHLELGNAYRNLSLFDEALKEYRQTLNLDPKNVSAQNNIGFVFWHLKAYPLAEEAFLKAVAMDEGHAEIHNNLASLYMLKKDYPRAAHHLERLVELQPENERARYLLDLARTLKDGTAP